MTNKISCIVPCYNGAEYVAEALDSLVRQVPSPDEILLVDDGSTDDSAAVAQATGHAQLRIIRQENLGIAKARNAGLHMASGTIICFMDHDDMAAPDHFATLLPVLESQSEVDAVFGQWENFWIDGMEDEKDNADLDHLAGPKKGLRITSGLLRRRAIDRVGNFRTLQDRTNGSEIDWMYRAKQENLVFSHVPHVVMHRRIHRGNTSRQNKPEDLFSFIESIRKLKTS